MLSKTVVAQQQDIYGTYFSTFKEDIGYDRCCQLLEVLKLNPDHTFSYYLNDNQGDYYIEGISDGRFKINGDSVFFLSKTPDSIKGVTCLPFADSISPGILKLSFTKFFDTVEPLLNLEYYEVDDSLNLRKLKVLKTDPDVKYLLDTMNSEIRVNYYKNQVLNEFHVYIQKPTFSNLLIKGDSI